MEPKDSEKALVEQCGGHERVLGRRPWQCSRESEHTQSPKTQVRSLGVNSPVSLPLATKVLLYFCGSFSKNRKPTEARVEEKRKERVSAVHCVFSSRLQV